MTMTSQTFLAEFKKSCLTYFSYLIDYKHMNYFTYTSVTRTNSLF